MNRCVFRRDLNFSRDVWGVHRERGRAREWGCNIKARKSQCAPHKYTYSSLKVRISFLPQEDV